MDLHLFEQEWEKSGSRKAAGQSFWDSRAGEFNDKAYTGEGASRLASTLKLLQERGVLTPQTELLDIGCGPGRYAVEFARQAKSVVATDVSPKMIDWAKGHRDAAGLANLELLVADWAALDLAAQGWEKKFDLVFAAMCPAINSRAALAKMNEASRKWCFMSHFVRRSDQIKDEVMRRFQGEKMGGGHGHNVYFAFNILWHMGLHPEITYIDANWETRMTMKEAVDFYLLHLNLDGPLAPAQEKDLREYLGSVANADGSIVEQVTAKIAWMIWQV